MVKVTGITCGGAVAAPPVPWIVTDPVYVPTAKPDGLIVTSALLGVAPLFGVTDSQVSPGGFVAAAALKVCTELSVAVTAMVCWVAVVEPANAVTLIAGWPTFSNTLLLTYRWTGIWRDVEEPGTVNTTSPVQTCELVTPVVFT